MIKKNKTAVSCINMKSGDQYENVFFAGTTEELINELQTLPFISAAGISRYIDMFYDNNDPSARTHLMLSKDDIESIEFSEKDPEAQAIAGRIIDLSEILQNATALRAMPDAAEEDEKCECCDGCDGCNDPNPPCERDRLENDDCDCCDCGDCDCDCDCDCEDIDLNARLVTFGMIMPKLRMENNVCLSPEAELYLTDKILAAVEIVMDDFCDFNEKYDYGSEEVIANLIGGNTVDIVMQEFHKINGIAFPIQSVPLFKDEDAFAKAIGKNVIDELIFG